MKSETCGPLRQSHEKMSATDEDFRGSASQPDLSRQTFLRTATTVYWALGVAFAAVPFIESWLPSETARALGGPTDIDISKVEVGQMIVASWRRHPVFVLHRTAAQLQLLQQASDIRLLRDPCGLERATDLIGEAVEECPLEIRDRRIVRDGTFHLEAGNASDDLAGGAVWHEFPLRFDETIS